MSVLTLSEAKTHLNITGTTQDDELQDTIDAAEEVIAQRCGPFGPSSRTAVVSGGSGSLLLPVTPVVSVESITGVSVGALSDVGTLQVNGPAGVVGYSNNTLFSDRTYTVTYTAGRTDIPADLLFAVKEMVRHLWSAQRGASSRPGSAPTNDQAPGYLIPNRVAELITPYEQHFGFA